MSSAVLVSDRSESYKVSSPVEYTEFDLNISTYTCTAAICLDVVHNALIFACRRSGRNHFLCLKHDQEVFPVREIHSHYLTI
ncbi:hypothetical protein RRG08_018300 [Elysia crispata]|uniref:Uncharacterized protein n=1 Tax=Elysia crispata TaxID=231223 RepID=A0AAE0YKG0_9GAST|nr:hypothetical protein RRG08_018300 [Elysia crispata]